MKVKPVIGTLILLSAVYLASGRSFPSYASSSASATYLSLNVTLANPNWNFAGKLRNSSSPFLGISGKTVTISTGLGAPGVLPYTILATPATDGNGAYTAMAVVVPWSWIRAAFLGDSVWQSCEFYVFPTSTTTATTIISTNTTTTTVRSISTSTTGTTSIQTTITMTLTSTTSTTMTIGATTAAFTITSPTTMTSTYTVFSVSTSTSTYWTDMTSTITSLITYTILTPTAVTITTTYVTTSQTTTTSIATSTTTVPFNVQDPITTYAVVAGVVMVIAFVAIAVLRQKAGGV